MARLFLALIAASVVFGAPAVALGHGGSYRGPAGEVPPGARDPSDPQPPPEHRGGTPTDPSKPPVVTPPGGDSTGGSPATPPARPGVPGEPRGGLPTGPGGARTPGAGPAALSFENWLFWWGNNRDGILNLKSALRKMQRKASTTSSHIFFGEGDEANRGSVKRPTDRRIRDEVVPALLRVIMDHAMHPDIRGGAVIALARCEAGPEHLPLFLALARGDGAEDQMVRESAILALGMLQQKNAAVRELLVDTLDDRKVPFRVRCFAAFTLGVLKDNHPSVFPALERRLDGSESMPDVGVSALISIGLLGDANNVPQLLEWFQAGNIRGNKLNDLAKAHLIGALGKIGDPSAIPAVESVFRKRHGAMTRRSAAIAMGQLLPQATPEVQEKAIRRITWILENDKDGTTRNFATIALGRIAGADGISANVRDNAVKALTRMFVEGGKFTERPFAALGLGLACFEGPGDSPKPDSLKYEIGRLLRETLAELKGDKTALGAIAVALGMVGEPDGKTLALLGKILEDRRMHTRLRGSAAIALGLIGDTSSRPLIRKVLAERDDRALRVDSAIAAGLLMDSEAVKVLVDVLNDPKASQFSLGSVALALGQIGDANALEPLLKILEAEHSNGVFPDLTRALVAVALGQMANPRDLRVLSRISTDINYRASVSALEEILTIL